MLPFFPPCFYFELCSWIVDYLVGGFLHQSSFP
jgi:hypothetical protein